MRAFCFSLLFLSTLAGCAKGHAPAPAAQSSGTVGAQHLVAVQPTASLAEAMAAMEQGELTCQDEAECPPNVGMLLAADAAGGLDPGSDSLLACTAVLVGPDLVLTNSHCVPSAVKLLPDLCASRVRVAFPGGATFACAQLLGSSARETPTSPDLALLRLESKLTGIKPLPLSRGGVENAAPLLSYRVNPDLKSRQGTLVASKCIAAAGTYRMPVYHSEIDSVFVMGDCQAVPGNSGSPVLNESGSLVGILQADLPLSSAALAQWQPNLEGASAFAPLAMGTSLACLASDPENGWSWNSACTTISDDDVVAARPRLHELLARSEWISSITAAALPFLKQSPLLDFSPSVLTLSALSASETIAPSCFRTAGGSQEISAQLPNFTVSVRFNRYTQLLAPQVLFTGSPLNASYSLNPATGELALAGQQTKLIPACGATRDR